MNGILNWNVDPVIFWVTKSFPLKYYGALFACGLLLGFYIVRNIYKKENLSLSERIYCCENCGFEIDRDLNAAINLSRLAKA